MKHGSIEFSIFQECFASFDGGAIFGHVPKVVWESKVKADTYNRIRCACNCLLIRLNEELLLVETGMGSKYNQDEKEFYSLESNSWEAFLASHRLTHDDIKTILLTHLHLDHAGGLTIQDHDNNLSLRFPSAVAYTQKNEIDAALHPDIRSKASYRPDDIQPLLTKEVLIGQSGSGELFPGCEAIITGGHTSNHQVFRFSDGKHELWYLGDIIPSRFHLKPNWVMGYDLVPLEVMKARSDLLPRLAQDHVRVIPGHDAEYPYGMIVPAEKGYRFIPQEWENSE